MASRADIPPPPSRSASRWLDRVAPELGCPPWDREDLLDLLAEARAEQIDADAALCVLFGVVGALASRSGYEPRLRDHDAERRVLGALLLGRADAEGDEVDSLAPADFDGPGHAALHAATVATMRQERLLGARVRPSRRRGPWPRVEAMRARVQLVRRRLAWEGSADGLVAIQGALEAAAVELAPGAVADAARTVLVLGRARRS